MHTPAARPSTPSVKLTTFITATIASPVTIAPPVAPRSTAPTNGSVNDSTRTPAATGMAAAAIWPASFTAGGRSYRSSSAPTSISQQRAAQDAACLAVERQEDEEAGDETPARIATPPRLGTGASWRSRSRGMSIAPTRTASRAVNGVATSVTTAATANAGDRLELVHPTVSVSSGRD